MRLISCHDGKLLTVDSADLRSAAPERSFSTGLPALDALLPNGVMARGAVHEVLAPRDQPQPYFFAAWLARAGSSIGSVRPGSRKRPSREVEWPAPSGVGARLYCSGDTAQTNRAPIAEAMGHPSGKTRIAWSDPHGDLYPPALAALGISLADLYLLRPTTPADEIWAVGECLACPGIAVTVGQPLNLSRIAARRLQLAAERGGGVGVLVRPHGGAASAHHAAATRWLVEPAPGERTVQRWKVQLIHAHGGRLDHPVYLEHSHNPYQQSGDRVRAVEELPVQESALGVQSG